MRFRANLDICVGRPGIVCAQRHAHVMCVTFWSWILTSSLTRGQFGPPGTAISFPGTRAGYPAAPPRSEQFQNLPGLITRQKSCFISILWSLNVIPGKCMLTCILLSKLHVMLTLSLSYYMYKSTRNQKNVEKCSTNADLHTGTCLLFLLFT